MATRRSRRRVKRVFLDTNGWLALLNASDALHRAADAVWKELGKRAYSVVLTDWVVAETGNGLARSPDRNRFGQAVRRLTLSSRVRVIYVSEPLLQHALALYEARLDKTWGLVDCASFVVMEEEGIDEAFSNDRHFQQAGFRCLLPLP